MFISFNFQSTTTISPGYEVDIMLTTGFDSKLVVLLIYAALLVNFVHVIDFFLFAAINGFIAMLETRSGQAALLLGASIGFHCWMLKSFG